MVLSLIATVSLARSEEEEEEEDEFSESWSSSQLYSLR